MQATTVLRLHITQPVFAGVGHKKIGKDIQMMKRKQEKLKNLKEKRDEQQQYKDPFVAQAYKELEEEEAQKKPKA